MAGTCTKLVIEPVMSILDKNGELFDKIDMNLNYLPRNVDILAHIYYLKEKEPYQTKFETLYQLVANKIVEIWKKTLIPTIAYGNKHGDKHIKKKIGDVLKAYKKIKRNVRGNRVNANDMQYLDKLFNMTCCKCINFECCECSFKEGISEFEYVFLLDQAKERKIEIDEYFRDVVVNQSLESELANLSTSSPPLNDKLQKSPMLFSSSLKDNTYKLDQQSDSVRPPPPQDRDPDYRPEAKTIAPQTANFPTSINGLKTDGVLLESMRFNASYEVTAAIMNRTLEGIGAITKEEKGLVVTPTFLRDRAKKLGNEISEIWQKKNRKNVLECFFFDGVSMFNNMSIEKNGRLVSDKSILYDNIAIVQQPNNHYLGFFSTVESDAETIFAKLVEFFKENNIDLNGLFAIGSDGASTNVGSTNGVITKFEQALRRPLHRIICLLHLLEVILKAVICFYYGENIIKYKNIGKINEEINNCHTFPVQKFNKIELANMPMIDGSFDSSVLNTDQKYLYNMGKAVSDGSVNDNLAVLKSGDIGGPRWTTLASRFLRLYVSTQTPSHKLISVVKFIQTVYIPSLFHIKCCPDVIYGSQHIYNMLMFSQCLSPETFSVVKERIQYNSYFAHTENLLLCMICDKDGDVRRAAYKIIINARSCNPENKPVDPNRQPHHVRIYKKPAIDIKYLNATNTENYIHYSKLVDWKTEKIYEPPFTLSLTIEELTRHMHSDNIIDFPKIPAHSQYVEYCVQAVKNAVTKYMGHKAQDARIKSKLVARKLNSKFNYMSHNKANFQVYDNNLPEFI